MTILDPVTVLNLTVYLVQLPRGRTSAGKQPTSNPVEFTALDQARASGEIIVTETGVTERVRLESFSTRDLFLQAGEVLRGGFQDRAIAGDLIIPAPRHAPVSHMIPVFCVEEHRWQQQQGSDPEAFTDFSQMVFGRKLKKELRLGTQDDVWREIAALNDALRDLVSAGGTQELPPHSLWMLMEAIEAQGGLSAYLHPLLPLTKEHPDATGVAFALNGTLDNAELYCTPALFRQLWPKLVWAIGVEALLQQPKNASEEWAGKLPTKGEVTAWLAGAHGRRAARHTDNVSERTQRRIRSGKGQFCFEMLDKAQDGLCVHEFILGNE